MRLIRLLKNDLARESAEWVKNDIISISQAEQICQQYDVDYHQLQSQSYGYNVLIGLAYLFIGVAVIILIGANWDEIPRAVRMGVMISLTILTQGFAVQKYFKGTGATVTFLLGNLFYGASIILIAQIYHLGEHMPDGVFWWAIGCMPLGLLLNNTWIMLQSLLLALLWFYMEISTGFYPSFFPLFIVGSIFVLYHGKQNLLLFLIVVFSVASWFEYTLANYWGNGYSFHFFIEHIPVSIALFIFAYVFSHFLAQKKPVKAKDYAAILAIWSLRFGLILLLLMSFKDPWKELINTKWEYPGSMWAILTSISVATLVLASRVKKLTPVVFMIPVYLIPILIAQLSTDSGHAIYFQIADNLALIIIGIWLIIRGLHTGTSHYFYLGVTTIILTAFMRYFDLIGSYIEGAILFSGFAAILIFAAKFWQRNVLNETQS